MISKLYQLAAIGSTTLALASCAPEPPKPLSQEGILLAQFYEARNIQHTYCKGTIGGVVRDINWRQENKCVDNIPSNRCSRLSGTHGFKQAYDIVIDEASKVSQDEKVYSSRAKVLAPIAELERSIAGQLIKTGNFVYEPSGRTRLADQNVCTNVGGSKQMAFGKNLVDKRKKRSR